MNTSDSRDNAEDGSESRECDHVESEVQQVLMREGRCDGRPIPAFCEIPQTECEVSVELVQELLVSIADGVLPRTKNSSVDADDCVDCALGCQVSAVEVWPTGEGAMECPLVKERAAMLGE